MWTLFLSELEINIKGENYGNIVHNHINNTWNKFYDVQKNR